MNNKQPKNIVLTPLENSEENIARVTHYTNALRDLGIDPGKGMYRVLMFEKNDKHEKGDCFINERVDKLHVLLTILVTLALPEYGIIVDGLLLQSGVVPPMTVTYILDRYKRHYAHEAHEA